MIYSVSFHEMAERELNEAAQYYEAEVGGLGSAFLSEVEYSIDRIKEYPDASPAVLKLIRKKALRRFPYSVLYSVLGERIRILAIASQKRRPFYWRARR